MSAKPEGPSTLVIDGFDVAETNETSPQEFSVTQAGEIVGLIEVSNGILTTYAKPSGAKVYIKSIKGKHRLQAGETMTILELAIKHLRQHLAIYNTREETCK